MKWGLFDQGQPHTPCGFYRRGKLGLGRGVGRGLGFGLGVGTMITGPPVIIVMFPILFLLASFPHGSGLLATSSWILSVINRMPHGVKS